MFEPISLAGTPAYLVFAFASPLTKALAPIIQFSPRTIPQTIVELAHILVPFLIKVFLNLFDQFPTDLGKLSFVVITFGPIKTSSSISTPS